MLQQIADSLKSERWSDAAVRDTIAEIVKDPAFKREIGQSLGSKIMRWIFDHISQLFETVKTFRFGPAIVYTLLVVAILLIVARIVIGVNAERMVKSGNAGTRGASTTVSFADAERLASGGDYTAAAHALFSSLLIAGAAQGQFRVHPSKTTGDYARELRRKSANWLRPFQSFRSRYDRVIYGDMICSADDYGALLADARTMLQRDRAA